MHASYGLAVCLAILVFPLKPFDGQGTTPAPPSGRPKVHVFATGGTIAVRGDSRLTVDELIKSVPNLDQRFEVTSEQFSNVSSGQITLAQWVDLSKRINDRFKKDASLTGVVVTYGTDTLEELAYFLHLTVRDERPVVIVGSMRSASTAGYEGVANLEDAFKVAAEPASKGMGALVVLNDQINSAREVIKTDTRLLNTFSSREYGALGTVVDHVQYFRKPLRRHTAQSEFDVFAIKELPRVDVLMAYQDAPGDLIKAAVDAGAKGIVIAGVAGGMAGSQPKASTEAMNKEVFVVLTSRSGGGSAGIPRGTSRRFGGDDLQPAKARILLMLALATTPDPAEVQRMFREY